MGQITENGVGNAGENALGPIFFEDFRCGGEGASGFSHVIDQQDITALDIADDVHRLDAGGGDAVFGDDGEVCAEGIGVGAGHFHTADIWRDDGEVRGVWVALAEVADEGRFRVEVVDWDVEETLDLWGVEVHGEDASDPGGGEEIGDEFSGDGDARLVFTVLPGVAEEGNHGGDAAGAGAAGSIDHDQQLHDVVVRRRARRLDDEDVGTANVFVDFNEGLTVWKGGNMYVGKGLPDDIGDTFGKGPMGSSTDEFHGA